MKSQIGQGKRKTWATNRISKWFASEFNGFIFPNWVIFCFSSSFAFSISFIVRFSVKKKFSSQTIKTGGLDAKQANYNGPVPLTVPSNAHRQFVNHIFTTEKEHTTTTHAHTLTPSRRHTDSHGGTHRHMNEAISLSNRHTDDVHNCNEQPMLSSWMKT